ncbi:PREDICTED: transcription factor TGA2 isoform X1 [Nelumbo nucifera]|uniref:BZIP protein n=1 Tax=Nelumbo nucifera TaxID=4432 RepID=L0CTJ5_NELNU|nr:transcription factor TGA2 [Nelumbo nucifera]XP_010244798.1 PREDICTED: transcription factor TGA2 isoform X1 [Nelumbo nucifera]XP_010244803.1 PREDICTED: transcription factor TGA2 isoform X1 [Nelumbo nucifera]AGA20434.1 bZIP protein [Nelumbo nucifera]
MASQRVGETGLSDSGPSNYPVFHGISHPTTNYINQQGSAFDFGELEQAIVLQEIKNRNDEAKRTFLTATRPAATLEMFPSWPMRFQQTPRGSSKSGESTDSGSAQNTLSCKADSQLEPASPISKKGLDQSIDQKPIQQQHKVEMANDTSRAGLSPNQQAKQPEKRRGASSTSEKTLDAKTLRRLAQNREAARKSRLRKKAYVQQLESSRIKLTQLEQELQRARSQGLFLGAGGAAGGNISSGAAIFDMEYSRWLEDDQRHLSELRTGLNAHLSDGDLRVILDGYLVHYDEIFRLKAVAAKSDVFHLVTGMWATPAERCFLWMGGFRPSELIKILTPQLDTLTEQQFMGICGLQQSSQQAEEALSQGLEQLHQSLSDTVATGALSDGTLVQNYMDQMAIALGKLSNLEGFVRQADNLRQQTLHQMRRILTIRQAARCFLAIGEYYNRLRALSSLWVSRPRENLISDENSCQTTTELQMVQSAQNHFSTF